MADITIVNGVYKPTYNWGAPSCSWISTIPMRFRTFTAYSLPVSLCRTWNQEAAFFFLHQITTKTSYPTWAFTLWSFVTDLWKNGPFMDDSILWFMLMIYLLNCFCLSIAHPRVTYSIIRNGDFATKIRKQSGKKGGNYKQQWPANMEILLGTCPEMVSFRPTQTRGY